MVLATARPAGAGLKSLAALVGIVAALAAALGISGLSVAVPLYVSVSGLVLAALLVLPLPMGAFLKFFVVFYGVGYAGLVALLLAGPGLPASVSGLIPPPLTAFTAAAFCFLAIGLSRIPVVASTFRISDPYFETRERRTIKLPFIGPVVAQERWIAFILLGVIIVINLAQVGISVRLNFWNREWFDSIQNKNEAEFWRLLLQVWVMWAGIYITSNVIEFVIMSVFKIRWRAWSTEHYTQRWLGKSNHYTLTFNGGVDNPDQRIQEDINKYITTTYNLSIALISQISTLISFSVILWGLSESLTFPGTGAKIPGLLLWLAIAYAGFATIMVHIIGRRLIPLNFMQERYEADFRFALARLREYAEQVALLKGEASEMKSLGRRFHHVITNFYQIVGVQKWLSAFTNLYGVTNQIVPYVIVAPFYFAGQVTLGVMTQTASAFGRVEMALSFIIDRYSTLADYKAVVDRLNGFDASLDKAEEKRAASHIALGSAKGGDITIPQLALGLPDGRIIASLKDVTFAKGERTLLVGPSGSGKSTLFRAISGIWPFGNGQVEVPEGASVMLLPQRPYLPIGALRAVVSYPASEGAHDDAAIVDALTKVRLGHLASRLDEEAHWSQVLSGGEQQRLSAARALLAKPDWLFLDEATSALDEPLEDALYEAIRAGLPETSLVSIGHRTSLIDNHDRKLAMTPMADGTFTITAQKATA